MILQQLRNDADDLLQHMPPSMYAAKPVKWIVRLSSTGEFEGLDQTSGGGKRDRGRERLVPFKNRTSAVQPLLLVDKVTYTWGLPAEHRRAAEEHRAYLDLLRSCAAETGNADVRAVVQFLESWSERGVSLPEMQPDELTTFTVEGRFPVDAPAVRSFWAQYAGGDAEAGTPGQCLVCGRHTRVVERLPVTVKGIPQGQSSGVALVSANAGAFESYGRSAGLNSPICLDCGERFGKAADALLSGEDTCLRVGPVAYLFWAPKADWDVITFLQRPQPAEVKRLLTSPLRGKASLPEDESPFFATAVTAAISRAVFRSWLHTTVGIAKAHIQRWFRLQEMVDAYGQPGEPLSVFRLSVSLYREARDIVPRVPETLMRAALHGDPLPRWLLLQAVVRNQAERDIPYARAALIKAVLCSHSEEDSLKMIALNPEHPNPAYHCGRLLAELEEIQRLAIPGINTTLVDRYYAGASAAPARVFGPLLHNAQDHLSKLRRTNGGAYQGFSERLEEIMGSLGEFPKTLTVQDQALFSLGYYHQRAADRAARKEAAERKRTASEAAKGVEPAAGEV